MADPTCRDVVELLLDYLEESLDPSMRAALEDHFRDCAPCVAYLRTYDRSRQLARDVTRSEAPTEVPENLKARLRQLLLRRQRAERF